MSALDGVRDEAVHGSYCPKMCTFACPVTTATGREDTKPWGLHVTVARLADGTIPADPSTYHALRGCTGCHACRTACLWDLDVPAEVRAARHAVVEAGVTPPTLTTEPPALPAGRGDAEVTVLVSCDDDTDDVAALDRLLRALGVAADFVAPDGCCGALHDDLGDRGSSERGRERVGQRLDGADRVVATSPHCLTAVPGAVDLVTYLAELGVPRDDRPVVWHDPCVLARDHAVVEAPRQLLAVVEPEHHGRDTACSGAGMAMDVLAPDEARMVAARRAEHLSVPGCPVVTGCPRARRILSDVGLDVSGIATWLAER